MKGAKYEEIPCTCLDDGPCNDPEPCKGECGCEACKEAYWDSQQWRP